MELVSTNLLGNTFSKLDARGHLDGHILFSGCYLPDRCFRVVDAKDPENLVLLAEVPVFDTEKYPAPPLDTAAGQDAWFNNDYNFSLTIDEECDEWLPGTNVSLGIDPPTCWHPGWNTHSHYVQENNKILVANQERYRTANTAKRASYAGLTIWDVRDPANPKYLSRFDVPKGPRLTNGTYTQAGGVHHFFFDGRYVYMGAEYGTYEDADGVHPGFTDRILVIVDLKDPKHPVEVGKWWVPGQRNDQLAMRNWIPQGSFNDPIWKETVDSPLRQKVGLHYTFVQGNRAYLSYHQAGVIILDITKVGNPEFISRLDYLVPPQDRPFDPSPDDAKCAEVNPSKAPYVACGNTHAAKLVPGRNLLLVSDEYFTCPYGHVRIVDIRDEKNPEVISHFSYPTQTDCNRDWGESTTPTAHLGTARNSNLYFMAWYAYGLRGIDISDPYNPVEAGHFFYRNFNGEETSVTYDINFGPGGLLYVTDNVDGIRVLKYTGPGNK